MINKRKIINDPVYGFINIPYELLFDIIEHPYFQRLRRIKQLGLTFLVYPGASHTRFQHALGTMHLMTLAIDILKQKGTIITDKEAEAACAAILLHDIGHGPFSHALENSIIPHCSHEQLSKLIMHSLNNEMGGKLDLAIELFEGNYQKKFLHQLITSQLDVDRLDYLRRDSFFSGVSEGVIGSDRIIKMLEVVDDELVIESKGIYSIEKFLIARRLMYWQVYLHKTVLASELMLEKVLKRARELSLMGINLFASPALKYYLQNNTFEDISRMLNNFVELDDYDILSALKEWQKSDDIALKTLADGIVNRNIYKIIIDKNTNHYHQISRIKELILSHYKISEDLIDYFMFEGEICNNAYNIKDDKINIYKNGIKEDIILASDMLNIDVLGKTVKKHYLCYPKYIHKEL
ncbi:MAG TPA: HD domain-containing protein [Bacteroidales bacterium]|nr:HD domain-containing protein [Bacteroidales bacterium]